MPSPLILVGRTLVFYALILFLVRLMGKREIGALSPFDLVITIMLAEMAALPIESLDLPLLLGAVPIVTLALAQIVLSFVCMKSEIARGVLCGNPSIVIRDGKIVEKEMRRQRYTISDLMEQLRLNNVANVGDVEFAILETNGQLSVLPKSQKRPVCCNDLNVQTQYEGLPVSLIVDGHIDYGALKGADLDLTWLKEQLKSRGITDIKGVLFCSLDSSGNLYIQERDKSLSFVTF